MATLTRTQLQFEKREEQYNKLAAIREDTRLQKVEPCARLRLPAPEGMRRHLTEHQQTSTDKGSERAHSQLISGARALPIRV